MESIKMTIPGDPRTKKNSIRLIRQNGRVIPIPSKQYRQFENEAGQYLQPLGIDEPVNLRCTYYMKTRRRVDLVNLLSATMDILVHYRVLVDDNAQIIQSVDGSCVMYDKTCPRTEIEITKARSQ